MQELGGGGDEIIIQLLHLWMQLLPAMRRLFDKKVAALGLTALLQIPVAEMPAPLQGGVDTLLMKTIEVLVNAERQAEQIAELDEEEEEEEEDEDDDEDGDEVEQEGLGDGEDATTDEDEAYMKYINEMRKKLAEQQVRVSRCGIMRRARVCVRVSACASPANPFAELSGCFLPAPPPSLPPSLPASFSPPLSPRILLFSSVEQQGPWTTLRTKKRRSGRRSQPPRSIV